MKATVLTFDGADEYATLLAEVWEKFRGLTMARLVDLESVSVALAAGHLSDDQRRHARGVAHKLAGAVGTYGYTTGSDLAQQADLLLQPGVVLGESQQRQLSSIVTQLRTELERPVGMAHSCG